MMVMGGGRKKHLKKNREKGIYTCADDDDGDGKIGRKLRLPNKWTACVPVVQVRYSCCPHSSVCTTTK